MSEPKLCPFCGKSNIEAPMDCVCQSDTMQKITRAEWNNRPIEDALLVRAEEAESRVKYLEADSVISNRELLIRDVEIVNLRADLARLTRELEDERRWIRCDLLLPYEHGDNVTMLDSNGDKWNGYYNCGFIVVDSDNKPICQMTNIVAWRPGHDLSQPTKDEKKEQR